jgi:hypothetical protein
MQYIGSGTRDDPYRLDVPAYNGLEVRDDGSIVVTLPGQPRQTSAPSSVLAARRREEAAGRIGGARLGELVIGVIETVVIEEE